MNHLKSLKDLSRIVLKIVFTREIVPYADRKRFWDLVFYGFAIAGAAFIFVGKIPIGLLLLIASFLFFNRAMRYDFHKKRRSELTRAIHNRDLSYIEYLLAKGTDANKVDGYGETPLAIAARSRGTQKEEIRRLLNRYGALQK